MINMCSTITSVLALLLVCLVTAPLGKALPTGSANVVQWSYEEKSVHISQTVHSSEDVPVDSNCDLCKNVVNHVKSEVKNGTKEDYEKALKQLCTKVPPAYRTICDQYLHEYMDKLVKLFMEGADAETICKAFDVCTSWPAQNQAFPKPECTLCKSVINDVKKVVTIASKEAYEAALKKACNEVPKPLRHSCNNMLEKLMDKLVDMLMKKVDTDTICKKVSLCELTSLDQDLYGSSCEKCKDAVNEIKKDVKVKTKEAYEQALKLFCTKLPEQYRDSCKEFMDANMDELVKMFMDGDDAEQICKTFSLCTWWPSTHQDESNGIECTLCKTVINMVKSMITDRTKAEIEHVLEEVCDDLPVGQEVCKVFVRKYSVELIKLLMKDLSTNAICSAMGLCADDTYTDDKSGDTNTDDQPYNALDVTYDMAPGRNAFPNPECKICKLVIAGVKNEVKVASKEAYTAALKKACNEVSKPLRPSCNKMLEKLMDKLVDLLMQKLDTDTICKKVSLCELTSLDQDLYGSSCEKCKDAVNEIKKEVKVKTKEAYEQALKLFCTKLPEQYRDTCKEFMDANMDELVKMFMDGDDAEQICKTFSLCTWWPSTHQDESNGIECTLCKTVINMVKNMITDRTKAEIEHVLAEVCDDLPVGQELCKVFVRKYSDELIKLLMKDLSTNAICSAMGLCADDTYTDDKSGDTNTDDQPYNALDVTYDMAPGRNAFPNPECKICKLVIAGVKNEVKVASKEAYTAALKKACNEVSKPLRPSCNKMLVKLLDKLVDLLMQKLDTDTICKKVSLCELTSLDQALELEGTKTCDACEVAVSLFKVLATNHYSETYIKNVLIAICNRTNPKIVVEKCTQYVNEKLPYIVQWLKNNLAPNMLCKKLKLCAATEALPAGEVTGLQSVGTTFGPIPPLGSEDPCMYGPSYWCSTSVSVQKCKAAEFCATWRLLPEE